MEEPLRQQLQAMIEKGVFPSSFGSAIERLRKDRELGDYGYQLSVEPQDSARDVKMAQEIVQTISVYLNSAMQP